ncbi:YkyA family protein [Scopulibacillus cellulosilyticus]|uniref:YkyA family protein n=1 Tax=Scopulibacillus cellulosilyticus TaxID=2665665 RepID=A0ABW2PSK8_9BACL
MRLFRVLPMLLITGLLLSACSLTESPSQKIYTLAEKSASKEKDFNQVQKPLVDAEEKEQAIYNQLVTLDKNNVKQTAKLSDQAVQSVENRGRLLKKEKKSIDNAYNTFKQAVPEINKIKDVKLKNKAKQMADTMKARYKDYQILHNEYSEALKDDRKLYELFKDKNLKIETLQTQLEKVNNHYKAISKDKETFNKATKIFNQQKKTFYDAADINNKK